MITEQDKIKILFLIRLYDENQMSDETINELALEYNCQPNYESVKHELEKRYTKCFERKRKYKQLRF